MAWTYFCDACSMNIMGTNKDELTDKVLRHANQAHSMHLTREQVKVAVDQKAKSEAA